MKNSERIEQTPHAVETLSKQAAALLDAIFFCGDTPDAAAQALIAIIEALAGEEDRHRRCYLAYALRRELFGRTPTGEDAIDAFISKAEKQYIEMVA
ncbi:MAG: hypothetical protein MOB07_26170 [Acidobacteria bacterium]|nr:hypothetical protein [Acidobacteriota bacterium]